MGNLIPFLYYDIFARVVPGALTLGVVRWCLFPSSCLNSLKEIAKGDGEAWRAVVVPLVIGGVCYVIGTLYEIVLGFSRIRKYLRLNNLSDKAFRRAWLEHFENELPLDGRSASLEKLEHKLPLDKRENCPHWDCLRMVRRWLWEDLVHTTPKASPPPFAHAHRFQAEGRMCLNSIPAALVFTFWAFLRACCGLLPGAAEPDGGASSTNASWFFIWGLVGLAMMALLVLCFYGRKLRRWQQLLNSTVHLDKKKRPLRGILEERFPSAKYPCLQSILPATLPATPTPSPTGDGGSGKAVGPAE